MCRNLQGESVHLSLLESSEPIAGLLIPAGSWTRYLWPVAAPWCWGGAGWCWDGWGPVLAGGPAPGRAPVPSIRMGSAAEHGLAPTVSPSLSVLAAAIVEGPG